MKAPEKLLLCLLVVLMMTTAQAMAASFTVVGQHGPATPYFAIATVTVTESVFDGTPTWDVVMTVAGALADSSNINNQYNVNFASNPADVFSSDSLGQDGHGLTPPTPTHADGVTFNFDPTKPTNFFFGTFGGLTLLNSGVTGNSLLWSIKKADLPSSFFFGGQTIQASKSVIDHTDIVAATATPIPGAAYLLGSGVLGLLGLKRRKMDFTA